MYIGIEDDKTLNQLYPQRELDPSQREALVDTIILSFVVF